MSDDVNDETDLGDDLHLLAGVMALVSMALVATALLA